MYKNLNSKKHPKSDTPPTAPIIAADTAAVCGFVLKKPKSCLTKKYLSGLVHFSNQDQKF